MKRLIVFAFTAAAALCLAACSMPSKNKASRPNRLGESFSSDVDITIEKLKAEGRLERSGDDWSVEFSEPNTLSGVKLEFTEGSVKASYKGLSFSVPQSAVPVKAMMLNLIKAVGDNSGVGELKGEEKDGLLRISGSLDGGSYTLSVDDGGMISGFDMPGYELSMSFTNVTANGSAPTTGTAAETTCVTTAPETTSAVTTAK